MGTMGNLGSLKREAEIAAVALVAGVGLGAFLTLRWVQRRQKAVQAIQQGAKPQEQAKDGGTVLARQAGPTPEGVSRVVHMDFIAQRPIAKGERITEEVQQLETPSGTREEVKAPKDAPVRLIQGLDTVGPMPQGAGSIRVDAWTALVTWSPQGGPGVAVQRSWGPWVAGVEADRTELRVMAGFTW